MQIQNETRISSARLEAEMLEVCDVMAYPAYDGVLNIYYGWRWYEMNRWLGENILARGGYISLVFSRILFRLDYTQRGIKIHACGPKRCRQSAMVHELEHWQGGNEKEALLAQVEFERRMRGER